MCCPHDEQGVTDASEEPVVRDAAPAEAVEVVDTREGYLEVVRRIRAGHGPIAVDAERASGFRYSQRAYLIQLFRRGSGTALLDPPAIGDFSELAEAMAGEEWVLHAASQDLACLREVGLDPDRIFDTELGARLLGFERVGLGPVVEQLLGLHLAKEHSAADWSTRPLPTSWLVYAALDVELLIDVRDREAELLAESGKTAIAEQEFEAVRLRETRPAPAEPWRRLSGVHAVRGAAQPRRRPRALAGPRRVRPRGGLRARAASCPTRRSSPWPARLPPASASSAAMRSFSGRASRPEIDRWWAAVEAGLAATDLPNTRVPSRRPAAAARLGRPQPRRGSPAEGRPARGGGGRRAAAPPDREPPHARHAPPRGVGAAARRARREAIGAALAAQGARPWQIEATADAIAAAFVRAAQTPPDSVEDDS